MGWWLWAFIVAPSWIFGLTQTFASCEGGMLAVALSHAATIVYEVAREVRRRRTTSSSSSRLEPLRDRVRSHLSQPEGFALLGIHLLGTWYLGLLPVSYYGTQGRGVNFHLVACQLLVQDFLQYLMHRAQHQFKWQSHQAHHRHRSPSFWDSFDGSPSDTCVMILAPLLVTAHAVPWCNVYDYMCFGSVYANWLCLIHSDAGPHAWDEAFEAIGLGTPRYHHIHHRYPHRHFGHLVQWW